MKKFLLGALLGMLIGALFVILLHVTATPLP